MTALTAKTAKTALAPYIKGYLKKYLFFFYIPYPPKYRERRQRRLPLRFFRRQREGAGELTISVHLKKSPILTTDLKPAE